MDHLVQLLRPLLRLGDVSAGQAAADILHRVVQRLSRRIDLPGLLPAGAPLSFPNGAAFSSWAKDAWGAVI